MINQNNVIVWEKGLHNFYKRPSNRVINPHEHQEEIWEKMDSHFLTHNYKAGIIWVPTGGGKTVIGVRWVLKNIINNGRKVIWFTHRLNLLLQAADTFQTIINADPDIFLNHPIRGALVAGSKINKNSSPTSWDNISSQCDIVFSTIQSARGKEDFVKRFLNNNPIPFIVIDECHHAQAPTYYKLLDFIKNECSSQLLGLSATPFCSNQSDTNRLKRLFHPLTHELKEKKSCYIHQIERNVLINKEILKKCKPDTQYTSIQGKRYIPTVNSDGSIVTEFGDLKPSILKKMAEDRERNEFIYNFYKNNQKEYDKTIIFTPNKKANKLLCDLFVKGNIYADYVDTDRKPEENLRILDEFRNNDNFKVLINVEIATEGYDSPRTKTVFITRPTRSKGLIQQMMGRAFRGKKAGGIHDYGHIVSFCEEWEGLYNEPTIEEIISDEEKTIIDVDKTDKIRLEEIKQAILNIISHLDKNFIYYPSLQSTLNHFPVGYYRIESFSDDEKNRESEITLIPIFSNYEKWFLKTKKEIKSSNLTLKELNNKKLFSGIPEPYLSQNDIEGLYDIITDNKIPEEELYFDNKNIHNEVKNALKKSINERNNQEKEIISLIYHNEHEIEKDSSFYNDIDTILNFVRNYRGYLFQNRHDVAFKCINCNFHQKYGIPKIALDVIDKNSKNPALELYLKTKFVYIPFPKEKMEESEYWGYVNYEEQAFYISESLDKPFVPLMVKEYILYHLAYHMALQTASEKEINYFEREFVPSTEAKEEISSSEFKILKYLNNNNNISLHNPEIDSVSQNQHINFCHKYLTLYEFVLRHNGEINLPEETFLKI